MWPRSGSAHELDLVDGQEVDLAAQRHGLDRADEIGGARRDDLLLAGDQGDRGLAAQLDDTVVDFAGQQPQRQADHARGVAQHPLDGQMGLASVGGAKNRRQLGRGQACGTVAHDSKVGWKAGRGKRQRGLGREPKVAGRRNPDDLGE
jgi:hypothetical protein